MNRDAILFHLREANEALGQAISDIEKDPDYDIGEFRVAMGHLYHHLNTAWHGRDASDQRHRECNRNDFDSWRKFPDESDVFLE